jgi:GTP cyclohydrolase I
MTMNASLNGSLNPAEQRTGANTPADIQTAKEGIENLLSAIGENPHREGLQNTPARFVKAMLEMTPGYSQDPAQILSTTFDQDDHEEAVIYGGVITLCDIEFRSLCEHHLLPFIGHVHICYAPGADQRIVGISKLARLVDCYSKRLQVQERLTSQIARAIETHLGASAVLVIVEAEHFCMKMRGCCQGHSVMKTMETRGLYYGDSSRAQCLRHEALGHIHAGAKSK